MKDHLRNSAFRTSNFYIKLYLIALIVILRISDLAAQSVPSLKLGRISEFKALFETSSEMLKDKTSEYRIKQELPNQIPLNLKVEVIKKQGLADVYYGKVENTPNSNFYIKFEGNKAEGAIILLDQKKYYSYSSSVDGTMLLTEKDINKVLCIGYSKAQDDSNSLSKVQATVAASVPLLESLPGAEAVVYLDFDGQTVSGTIWNQEYTNGEPIVAEPSNLSETEIIEVWKLISEDFLPFNLNVTTSEAVFNSAPANKRMKVIFTPTNYFNPGWGGLAHVGSFTWGGGGSNYGETPCWVWATGITGAGEAGAHEIGHTLNLIHDGRILPDGNKEEYYEGHSSWAPIMGTGYNKLSVQWSKGEYINANNTEDDLQIITTRNGFGYRSDDHSNNIGNATPIKFSTNGDASASENKGIISTTSDVDVFSFTTTGGPINLTVSPNPDYANLDVLLTLRNSAGAVVLTQDPSTAEAHINTNLKAGTYYLVIDGTKGDMGANSDYGSLGAYTISMKGANQAPVVSLTSPANNTTFTAPATIAIAATATDADGTISKVEFYNGSTKLGEDTNSPYSYSWSNVAAGTYALTAKATDDKGATTTSATVNIIVNAPSNTAPVVSITSPANNATFTAPASITISASASDADGTIGKVEFFNGNTKLGEDLTSPYSYSWGSVAAGTYQLTARAVDNSGAAATSALINITVNNPTNSAPAVSINSPANNATFSAPASIAISANASDTDGAIAKVEFFQGSTKLGEDVTAPYTYNWTGVAAGNYALTAKATDDKGASTISAAVNITVGGGGNQAPTVTITSPRQGQKFTIYQNPIKLEAIANDADGEVKKVEFYVGAIKVGEDRTAPYTYSWWKIRPGTYSITAKATDNEGAVTTSEAIVVVMSTPIVKKNLAASQQHEDAKDILVYPNPVNNSTTVTVDLPETYQEVSLIINDLSTGKRISNDTYRSTQSLKVDISTLTRGVYSFTIIAEGEVRIKKLFIL